MQPSELTAQLPAAADWQITPDGALVVEGPVGTLTIWDDTPQMSSPGLAYRVESARLPGGREEASFLPEELDELLSCIGVEVAA